MCVEYTFFNRVNYPRTFEVPSTKEASKIDNNSKEIIYRE